MGRLWQPACPLFGQRDSVPVEVGQDLTPFLVRWDILAGESLQHVAKGAFGRFGASQFAHAEDYVASCSGLVRGVPEPTRTQQQPLPA